MRSFRHNMHKVAFLGAFFFTASISLQHDAFG